MLFTFEFNIRLNLDLKNEDDLKNEENLKNKDALKNEDDLKHEDDLKNEDDLQIKTVPGPRLHSPSCACCCGSGKSQICNKYSLEKEVLAHYLHRCSPVPQHSRQNPKWPPQ